MDLRRKYLPQFATVSRSQSPTPSTNSCPPQGAYLLLDVNGIIIGGADDAGLLLAFPVARAVGMPVDVSYAPDHRAAGLPQHDLREAVLSGQHCRHLTTITENGDRVDIVVCVTPVRNSVGKVVGYVRKASRGNRATQANSTQSVHPLQSSGDTSVKSNHSVQNHGRGGEAYVQENDLAAIEELATSLGVSIQGPHITVGDRMRAIKRALMLLELRYQERELETTVADKRLSLRRREILEAEAVVAALDRLGEAARTSALEKVWHFEQASQVLGGFVTDLEDKFEARAKTLGEHHALLKDYENKITELSERIQITVSA